MKHTFSLNDLGYDKKQYYNPLILKDLLKMHSPKILTFIALSFKKLPISYTVMQLSAIMLYDYEAASLLHLGNVRLRY